MKKKRKRRHYTKKRRTIVLKIKITAFFLFLIAAVVLFILREPVIRYLKGELAVETNKEVADEDVLTETQQFPWEKTTEEEKIPSNDKNSNIEIAENDIYTFMQGPKAWNSKTDWSGEWCEEVLAGSKFSVFGCGLCNLANIYSTLTSYECSPVDMFYYAKEASSYSPGGGYGAIDWPEMRDTLHTLGFTCEIHDKDETFEEFCEAVENSLTCIALVSSYVDSSYWTDTEGHYVNLWLYNGETGNVFLADSGNPSHNRSWIPLRYVYDALKTYGSHQYMLITSYDESQNSWKHSGIQEDWAVPEYYHVKENTD